MHRSLVRLASLLLAFVSLPVAAQDTSLIVLGIRSVEGDEELARDLTGALRQAASQVPGVQVSQADVTLTQMSMVHGCDEPDAACMAEIAGELQQKRIIYGTVRRTGAGAQYDFALTLYYFNAESGQIEDSLTDTIPRAMTDIDPLRPRATRYVARFTNQTRYGSARVTTNVPGATVAVDGNEVGTTNEAGAIDIPDLTEGEHALAISADGHDGYEGSFTVVADERTDFRASLAVDQGTNFGWIPGAALIAGGAVMFGLGLRSWGKVRDYDSQASELAGREGGVSDLVNRLRDDGMRLEGFSPYQHALLATPQGSNACRGEYRNFDSFEDGLQADVRSACDDLNKHSALQYVFNFTGLVLAGAGITWLIVALTGGSDEADEAAAQRVRLTPMASRRNAGLHFAIDF
ncbi:MAG: PEGA domain-containing protein [Sandaracinus sp.]|nr:PEGA domain-containing protein [Sandaracinus sp.]